MYVLFILTFETMKQLVDYIIVLKIMTENERQKCKKKNIHILPEYIK